MQYILVYGPTAIDRTTENLCQVFVFLYDPLTDNRQDVRFHDSNIVLLYPLYKLILLARKRMRNELLLVDHRELLPKYKYKYDCNILLMFKF